jgi:hypothetical protein
MYIGALAQEQLNHINITISARLVEGRIANMALVLQQLGIVGQEQLDYPGSIRRTRATCDAIMHGRVTVIILDIGRNTHVQQKFHTVVVPIHGRHLQNPGSMLAALEMNIVTSRDTLQNVYIPVRRGPPHFILFGGQVRLKHARTNMDMLQ